MFGYVTPTRYRDLSDARLQSFFSKIESITIWINRDYKIYLVGSENSRGEEIPRDDFALMLKRAEKLTLSEKVLAFLFNTLCALLRENDRDKFWQDHLDRALEQLLILMAKKHANLENFVNAFDRDVSYYAKHLLRRNIEDTLLNNLALANHSELVNFFPSAEFSRETIDLLSQLFKNNRSMLTTLMDNESYTPLVNAALKLLGSNKKVSEVLMQNILSIAPDKIKEQVSDDMFKELILLLLSQSKNIQSSAYKKEWLEVMWENYFKNNRTRMRDNLYLGQWIDKADPGWALFLGENLDSARMLYEYLTLDLYSRSYNSSIWGENNVEELRHDYFGTISHIYPKITPQKIALLIKGAPQDKNLVRNLLETATLYPEIHIDELLDCLFVQYKNKPESLAWISVYFDWASKNPLSPRGRSKQIIQENLEYLLENYPRFALDILGKKYFEDLLTEILSETQFSTIGEIRPLLFFMERNQTINQKTSLCLLEKALLLEDIAIADIGRLIVITSKNNLLSSSRNEALLNAYFSKTTQIQSFLVFMQNYGIKDALFIRDLVRKIVTLSLPLTDKDIENLISLLIKNKPIDSSSLTAVREILNQYPAINNPVLKGIIERMLKDAQQPIGNLHIEGLLYAYLRGILPDSSAFDFMLEDYYKHCYEIWASCAKSGEISVEFNPKSEENSMRAGQAEIVCESVRYNFPGIDPNKSYEECIQYIETELLKLEGHNRALHDATARKRFIPDNPTLANKMSDKESALARYHTALRLLKRDPVGHDIHGTGLDPYFLLFNDTVGYCYALAKRANSQEVFIEDLVYIRREHNRDENKVRRYTCAEDFPSCSSGAEGRFQQAHAIFHNLIREQRSQKENELKPFNTALMADLMKDFFFKSVKGITKEGRTHLAWLVYYYQLSTLMLEEETDVAKAKEALSYILDHELNYRALYQTLLSLYGIKKEACPPEIEAAFKAIISYQLHLFWLKSAEDSSKKLAIWAELPNQIVQHIHPSLLTHFLTRPLVEGSDMDFKKLVDVAEMVDPEILQGFKKLLLENLSTLAYHYVRDASEKDITAFIKNILFLMDKKILTNDDAKIFFDNFFKKIDSDEFLSAKAIFLLETVRLEEATSILPDCIKKSLEEFIERLLTAEYYRHYKQLKFLIEYVLEKKLLLKADIILLISKQALEFIKEKHYTAYARLLAFAHQYWAKISPYNRAQQDNQEIQEIQQAILEKRNWGSFSPIFGEQVKAFHQLADYSLRGDAYASFALSKLYDEEKAIFMNVRTQKASWVENKNLALIYAAVAIQQATVMGNTALVAEVRSFYSNKFFEITVPCLEELYYTHMLNFLNAPQGQSPAAVQTFQNLSLIAQSIDLGALLIDSTYSSKNKTAAQGICTNCLQGKDLSKADALLELYEELKGRNCYIQTSGGTFYAADPRITIPEVCFQKWYPSIDIALRAITSQTNPIEYKKLYSMLAQSLKIDEVILLTRLQHIYQHMKPNDQKYAGNIYSLGTEIPPDQVRFELLSQICKLSNINVQITSPWSEQEGIPKSENADAEPLTPSPREDSPTISLLEPGQYDEELLLNAIRESITAEVDGGKITTVEAIMSTLKRTMPNHEAMRLINSAYDKMAPAGSSSSSTQAANRHRLFTAEPPSLHEKLSCIAKPLVVQVVEGVSEPVNSAQNIVYSKC